MTDDLSILRSKAEREWDTMHPAQNIFPHQSKESWVNARVERMLRDDLSNYSNHRRIDSPDSRSRQPGLLERTCNRLDAWLDRQPWYVQLATLAGISSAATWCVLELGAALARIVP